jgi:hypothetical protein
MADSPRGTVDIAWTFPTRPSTAEAAWEIARARPFDAVGTVNGILGYDVMRATGAVRFAAEDYELAEGDMAAQNETLEPYDE